MAAGEKIQIDVFIPDSKVTTLIGTSGQQISSIQKTSNSLISVQKKINGLRDRAVRVNGKPLDVKEAITLIYKMIFEKRISPPRRVSFMQHEGPSLRFVAPSEIAKELSTRHSSLTKKLRTEYNVEINVRDSKAPLKESESVVVRLYI